MPTATPVPQRALPDDLRIREVVSQRGMVVTSAGPASWAGARMLEAGGNAVDAAVAAAFALGVAEPGSSGIGGQTYVLIHLADGRSVAIDGSARAPLRAPPEQMQLMRDENPDRKGFYSYKAIATPGSVAALALALERYGSKPLAEVLEPAIEIAEFGSAFTPAHRAFLQYYAAKVRRSPYLSRLFLRDGIDVWELEHVYCNSDLACTLRQLRDRGLEDFYHGKIAQEIDADMIAGGGFVRLADLGLLEAKEKKPIRGRYRGLDVLSFPSPGGGQAIIETLAILDRFPPDLLREDTVDRLHLLLEAQRLAYADGFPAHRPLRTPDELAVDPAYTAARAGLIRFDRALYARELSASPLSTLAIDGTSQVSVTDAAGNAVALTQTLGATFGSGAATAGLGFAYNGLMNGFEFRDQRAWVYVAPLQPALNSMAPTIVLKEGKPLLVLGSAGSARIAPLIVSTIVGVVDRGWPLCEAMAAPRVLWGGTGDPYTYLEIFDPITLAQADALKERGFTLQDRLNYPASALSQTDFGGVNAIFIDPADGTMVGVGDPRRQAVAAAPRDELPRDVPPFVLPRCWRSLYWGGTTPTAKSARQAPQSTLTKMNLPSPGP